MTIKIPYKPRPIWRDVIHPALRKKRFAVLVCHRRFGKTIGSINELIRKAVLNKNLMPQYAYVAPYRNQAKMIAWKWLLYYTSVIPGRKVNASDLYVELPSMHGSNPGARIYIIGADHPDALRGMYLDGVVIDEYAQIRTELYGEVIRPALADRAGFAYFIGTPKGQNAFYNLYQRALKDDQFFTCLYRYDETGILAVKEIESMKKDMTEAEFRQELLCDFTSSASNVVITIDTVTDAAHRELLEKDVKDMPIVLGVDVARFGGDRTVIQMRQGLMAAEQAVYKDMDTMEVASVVAGAINRYHPDVVFIDVGGIGAGVVDRLNQMGYTNIVEINFGSAATEPERYANIRAEMYFKANGWLKAGGSIPDDPELKTELTVTEYKFTSSGKIILVPKEKIKEMMGASPDRADAFVLTFAMPVAAKALVQRRISNISQDYDPFKDY